MKNKYLSKRIESGSLIAKPFYSYLWKDIMDMHPKIDNLSFWEVGKGASINVWDDVWVAPGVQLKDHVQQQEASSLNIFVVTDLITLDGRWNWTLFCRSFPKFIIDKIHAISPPDGIYDTCFLGGTKSGIFSISSLNTNLINSSEDSPSIIWDSIWRL